jgi:phosphoribosylaminoimidazolecarboxamide formyltransferase/IMP cyclohydrolase
MDLRTIRRALVSVSDKSGLVEFARGLTALGVELISTGGTHTALASADLPVRQIGEVTGFPEILDGRVKSLHPRIHAGILAAREDPRHVATLAEHKIQPIDLVVCNLYPFEQVAAAKSNSHDVVIENIDVGGPSMIRAAAKNYADVAVITEPGQYAGTLQEMRENGGALRLATRERLAAAAFARTAEYDAAIAAYFARRSEVEGFPLKLELSFVRKQVLRYGENPHQKAAFYAEPDARGASVATAEVLHGKELSFNNILDLDSALALVREFAQPAAVVIKHNNPCGAAVGETPVEAFSRAYAGDPLSAFGGILGFNRPVDELTATLVTEPNRFVEAIIAPDFDETGLRILTTRQKWGKNVRLLRTGAIGPRDRGWDYRRVDGGLLVEDRDLGDAESAEVRVVTKRAPTKDESAGLAFAWQVCKHVKSNAIVLTASGAVVGVGAGQMSRVDSVEIAVRKAGSRSHGAVLASDAFFPFRDNVDAAAKAGVTAIIQPGGSVRDAESIAACDEHGIAMVFTSVRHFRH